MEKLDYEKLGLMQLRIYARNIGVKAPTIYTKSELIEKIKEVENGVTNPYFTDRGRPQINKFIEFNKKHSSESPNELENDNIKLKSKIDELTNLNLKIENDFYEFKRKLIEIIKDL